MASYIRKIEQDENPGQKPDPNMDLFDRRPEVAVQQPPNFAIPKHESGNGKNQHDPGVPAMQARQLFAESRFSPLHAPIPSHDIQIIARHVSRKIKFRLKLSKNSL